MNQAYLLLGSNLGDRISNLNNAIDLIALRAGNISAKSSIYETEPWGVEDVKIETGQSLALDLPYLNMVIEINTSLNPYNLLKQLLEIEKDLGRHRTGIKNEPRTIDIDILIYGDIIINSDNLDIPHKRMHQRRFVLVPMAEINALLVHPVFSKNISQLLDICEDESWVRKFEHE